MKYPDVLDEFKTIHMLIDGYSIARFGDGEMNHLHGKRNVSQVPFPKLTEQLKEIIRTGNTKNCLVGIPPLNDKDIRKKDFWLKGRRKEQYAEQLNPKASYCSSFISRPDNQPALNTQTYYDLIRKLWIGKDIMLISPNKSFKSEMMKEVKSIEVIDAPKTHAYCKIDEIEEAIGTPSKTVMLCLGPTATVLAWKLAKKGVHALDLGFLGTFFDNFHKSKVDIFTEKDPTRNGAFYLDN